MLFFMMCGFRRRCFGGRRVGAGVVAVSAAKAAEDRPIERQQPELILFSLSYPQFVFSLTPLRGR